jgi:hypothetical protein
LLLEIEVLLADLEAEVAALLETAGDWLDMVRGTEEGDGGVCQKPVKASAWRVEDSAVADDVRLCCL